MFFIQRIRNVIRAVKQKWGTAAIKRALWNQEFAEGHWTGIENTPGDLVYDYIERYSADRSILDLGCGSGNTGCELRFNAYKSYTGVDISDVAVEQARARSRAAHREEKNQYFQSDIANYTPSHRYDIILFRESIYYLPRNRIRATLHRYCQYLAEDGVVVLRCAVREDGEAILDLLGDDYRVVEKYSSASGPVVAVLRPLRLWDVDESRHLAKVSD